MGFGDEIMALGRAERRFLETGRPVAILDAHCRVRTHELWEGSPAVDPESPIVIVDGPKARPYIRRWEGNRAIYETSYRPSAGHVNLTGEERARVQAAITRGDLAPPYAVISPGLKQGASENKAYGLDRWEKVIEDFPIPVYQLGATHEHPLAGARYFRTETMRDAAAVVERAAVVLTNEGGLHHLAASMRVPAVVIFGGFSHPLVTGYDTHINLTGGLSHIGCGSYAPCGECKNAMANIDPAVVKRLAQGVINAGSTSKSLRWF